MGNIPWEEVSPKSQQRQHVLLSKKYVDLNIYYPFKEQFYVVFHLLDRVSWLIRESTVGVVEWFGTHNSNKMTRVRVIPATGSS